MKDTTIQREVTNGSKFGGHYINVRMNADTIQRIRGVVASESTRLRANLTLSWFVRAAVEEKLERESDGLPR